MVKLERTKVTETTSLARKRLLVLDQPFSESCASVTDPGQFALIALKAAVRLTLNRSANLERIFRLFNATVLANHANIAFL
jgi:hypothetical protein